MPFDFDHGLLIGGGVTPFPAGVDRGDLEAAALGGADAIALYGPGMPQLDSAGQQAIAADVSAALSALDEIA